MCTCAEGKDETDDTIMYAAVYNMVLIFLMNREYSTLHARLYTHTNEVPRKESMGDISK
jgi:hypothetical protein